MAHGTGHRPPREAGAAIRHGDEFHPGLRSCRGASCYAMSSLKFQQVRIWLIMPSYDNVISTTVPARYARGMNQKMKKKEFVERYIKGEPERSRLLNELFRAEYAEVTATIHRMFWSWFASGKLIIRAEDAASVAFDRFWSKAKSYIQDHDGSDAQTQTYITTIARRFVIDQIRSYENKVRALAASPHGEEFWTQETTSPTPVTEELECHDKAFDEFSRADPRLALILTGCAEGKSHKELAEELELPAANIRKLLYQARAKYKALVEKYRGKDSS